MVYINIIQVVLMMIVVFILLGFGYEYFSDGVKGFLDKLVVVDFLLVLLVNLESFLFWDYFEIVFCFLIVGIVIVCQFYIIIKLLLFKDEWDVNWYLFIGILVEILFFFVVLAGFYVCFCFLDFIVDGVFISMDGIILIYVVMEFLVMVGLVVIFGLIFVGFLILEGFIQLLFLIIILDIIDLVFGYKLGVGYIKLKWFVVINKIVIVIFVVIFIVFFYEQLIYFSLSVGIFVQNGVYVYFFVVFVFVLMGIFLKEVFCQVLIVVSFIVVFVYFGIYYGCIGWYMQAEVCNLAVVVIFVILVLLFVGGLVYFWLWLKEGKKVVVCLKSL